MKFSIFFCFMWLCVVSKCLIFAEVDIVTFLKLIIVVYFVPMVFGVGLGVEIQHKRHSRALAYFEDQLKKIK